jgi:glutaredoxin-related protein
MTRGFKKYFITFFITAALFAGAWYASVYFNNKKITALTNAQKQATLDVISSETQFALLQTLACQDTNNTLLDNEIGSLADKITYGEQNFSNQAQLNELKQQYTILEVKDYLLTKQISQRCKQNIVTILYFYKNANVCPDCVSQGYVLDALRQQYPQIRSYAFDATLDSSTVRALLTIYKIPTTLPALVINGKLQTGLLSLDDIKKILPKDITNPPKTAATGTASVKKTTAKTSVTH